MRALILLLPAVALAATPRYARLGETTGPVEIQLTAASPWIHAERNLPLPESAWIRTGAGGRAEIEFDEGSVLHLGPQTQAGLADDSRLSTGQRITLVTVDRGLAYLSGAPEGNDSLVLAVPGAQITFTAAARLRAEVEEHWSRIAILAGAVRFSSPAAELALRAGQITRVEPANPARFFLDREVPPNDFDAWSRDRVKLLASSTSAAHTVQRYGLADLDAAGHWIVTKDLGSVWKPKVTEDWLPFQSGRWRWYDALGYTWVGGETWGWLPYHCGRWARLEDIGWVWVPSKNGIFKPGDVYWLRAKDTSYIGWGPLAPGASPSDPANAVPADYLNAYTTYAAFRPGAPVIDPAGFTARPSDPLRSSIFEASPPSPPFLSATLDAVRPLVAAPRVHFNPLVEGTTVDTISAASLPAAAPPAPTVVVVTQPAPPAPAPDPEVVGVPVPVAVPVPAGILVVSPPSGRAATKPVSAPPPPQHARGGRGSLPGPLPPHRRFRNSLENGLYTVIVKDLETRSYAKALTELDGWTERFRDTDYAGERLYYYMLAYNGLDQPAKVLDAGAPLFRNPQGLALDDPMQTLAAAYLAASNSQKLSRLTREQSAAAKSAGAQLLSELPICFTRERKPAGTADTDWEKARRDLEALARRVVARH